MNKVTFLVILVGLLLASSQAQADQQIQVIKLFDELLVVFTGEVKPDPVLMKTTTATIVRGAQDIAILSSTPDGTGIPNVDDFITINGEFVQSGWYIPAAVFDKTGILPDIPACTENISVNVCFLPHPHHHPVDVSDVIPVGRSTVAVEIWDFGGSFGHTELYLIIVPRPLQ